ncbi:molybdopterin molybdotransferase MoeA [Lysobacter korlensis]|uniref:Molybdopterin molybdenumtransferase n=1 Tax=Lysobacter korlensis TaxID=553636 RepID=A0ABV6RNR0_9GAMM
MSVTWDAARELAYTTGRSVQIPTEKVRVDRAVGRVAAAALSALVPLPTTDVSAMDGWAVAGEPPWTLGDPVPMGSRPDAEPFPAGTARAIPTGAAVPAGASGVLRAEHGRVWPGAHGTVLEPSDDAPPVSGANVRRRGDELDAGTPLFPAGTLLTPPRVALAAATGHDRLPVMALPRVAVLVSGDEVAAAGEPAPGTVRDALGPVLPWLIRSAGGTTSSPAYLPDRLDDTVVALAAATVDLVVVTGGSSHGRGDQLRHAIQSSGGEMLVASVQMRPGHPVVLALTSDRRPILGLPGNPFAAFAAFLSFGVPLLRGALGLPLGELESVDAPEIVAQVAPTARGNAVIVPVTWHAGAARPVEWRGSAMLRGVAEADGLLVVEAGDGAPRVRRLGLPW